MTNNLFFFCIFLSYCKASRRIVGGRDSHLNEFPFVASWGDYNTFLEAFNHVCTCTILSPTWSISAAHCAFLMKYIQSKINHSLHLPTEKGKISKVLQVLPHPRFEYKDHISTLRYDVCVLKTDEIILNQYGKLSAVDHRTLTGHQVYILGFGRTNQSEKFESTLSLKIPLQVLNGLLSRCLENDFNIPMTFCVVPKCGVLAVLNMGDSGGPVIHASGLIGVISGGTVNINDMKAFKRAHKYLFSLTSVGIISAVSPSMDWISNVTRQVL